MNIVDKDDSREVWRPHQFALFSLSACSGIAAFIRSTWLAVKYEGSGFLYLFIAISVLVGLPLHVMELSLGQILRKGAVEAFAANQRSLKGIGLAAVWLSALLCWCYSTVVGFNAIYTYEASYSPFPFAYPTSHYNVTIQHFENNIAHSNVDILSTNLFLALLSVWVAIFLLACRGVKGVTHLAVVTFIMWFAMIAVLLIAVCVHGGSEGLRASVTFHPGAITSEMIVDIIGQVLLSGSLGSAVLVAFGSFNHRSRDVVKYSLSATVSSVFITVLSVLVVYGGLGVILKEHRGEIFYVGSAKARINTTTDVIRVLEAQGVTGFELTYVVFCQILARIDSTLPGLLFFLSSSVSGLLSLQVWYLAMFGTLRDKFPNSPAWRLALISCGIGFVGSVVFTTSFGYDLFTHLDRYLVRMTLPIAVMFQSWAVGWRYDTRERSKEATDISWCKDLVNSAYYYLTFSVGTLRDQINANDKLPLPIAWCAILKATPLLMLATLSIAVVVEIRDAPWTDSFQSFLVILFVIVAGPAIHIILVVLGQTCRSPEAHTKMAGVWPDSNLPLSSIQGATDLGTTNASLASA
eukprot:Sspe_Gene.91522::Locus_63024_Transcript_1_1_Confidence_1.000_Length_1896::g.91522::m.91522